MIYQDKKADIQAWVLDAFPAGVLKNQETLEYAIELLCHTYLMTEGHTKCSLSQVHESLDCIATRIYKRFIDEAD